MLEKFPRLQKGEVTLSRADINTGIVLDDQCIYATNATQKIYTIFNDIHKALEVAKEIIEERNNVECYIHEGEKQVLYHLDFKTLHQG